ncbi:MAG: protein kinase [Chloroflexota bacterium]|nr:protein kinase [Chloroflexota bacterium]
MPEVIAHRYQVLDNVGQGGMATVYRAMDTRLGRLVAIKLLREPYADDPTFTQRFQNEARAAARLSHSNIVDIYDCDQAEGRYFIAMEYVTGQNLKEYIREHAPLPEGETKRLVGQLLEGLGAAHAVGLIHRDIKPQNVLITADGRLKIADFGIAKAMGDAGVTEAGMVVGTAHYMAPEQVCGYEVSARTDLYAVGVMLYEMLTGVLPFNGTSPIEVAHAHAFEQFQPVRELAPEVSPGMAVVVERAMAKDPEERYADTAEMLAALQEVAASSEPVSAASVRPGRRGSLGSASAPTTLNLAEPAGLVRSAGSTGRSHRKYRLYWVMLPLLLMALVGLVGYTTLRDTSVSISANQLQAVGSPTVDALPSAGSESSVAAPTDQSAAVPTVAAMFPVVSTLVPAQTATQQATPPRDPRASAISSTITPQPRPTDTQTPDPTRPPTGVPIANVSSPTPPATRSVDGSRGGASRKELVTVELDATEFEGGYWRPDGYKGHTAEWVYSQQTDYSEMTAEFRIEGEPKGDAKGNAGLGMVGMDSPGPGKTRIRIRINGKVVYEGDNPLGNDTRDEDTADWTKWSKLFPASYLKQGSNRVTITNLEEVGGRSDSFFMLDGMVVVYYEWMSSNS